MKRRLILLCVLVVVIGFSGVAKANLTLIGTASYDSDGNGIPETYNLIYDEAQGLVWLDYSNPATPPNPDEPWVGYDWYDQNDWVSDLGLYLTIDLNPGVTTDTDWSTGWRLPETVDDPWEQEGWDGNTSAGWNITTSEMGHLYYVSLGNLGYYDTDGTQLDPWWYDPDGNGYGLKNTGPFNNLHSYEYWSTKYSHADESEPHAWRFHFYEGSQNCGYAKDKNFFYALAVRPGVVQTIGIALVEKAGEILDLFDEAVADGTLEGTGNAKAAPRRLNAVRNKIIEAESFIAGGDYESALAILYDIYKLSDGKPKPPDLVQGSAAADLADEVWTLIEMIEEATS